MSKKYEMDMTTGVIMPKVITFALPLMAASVLQLLFNAADIVVVGAPMYNFGIASQLRAWIDRILVAGKTFRYDENGAVGLCGAKKLVIASSRGGVYSAGSPVASLDHQETYLKDAFGFIGITDITFIRAEGVAMGPDKRSDAIASAKEAVAALAA